MRCLARALAKCGARVAVWDIVEEAARKVADRIVAEGETALPVECDVLDRRSCEAAAEPTEGELGDIHVLINGAGGDRKEATTGELAFFDLPEEAVRFVLDLNFTGTLIPTQVVGRGMAERGKGVILNISSINAFRPLTRIPAYSAARAAVSNFTQWLAVHMCQSYSSEIRVNAIAPGFFMTEQNRFLLTDRETGDLTARGKSIIGHTPMGRFGDPEDLVGAVVWLISDQARFVTGVVIPIDGGFSAFSGV